MSEEEDKDKKSSGSGSGRAMNPGDNKGEKKVTVEEKYKANAKAARIKMLLAGIHSKLDPAMRRAILAEVSALFSEIEGIIDVGLLNSIRDAIEREDVVKELLSPVSDLLSKEGQKDFERKSKEMEALRERQDSLIEKFALDDQTRSELDRLHKKAKRGEELTDDELRYLLKIPIPTKQELVEMKANRAKLKKRNKALQKEVVRLKKTKADAIKKDPKRKAAIERVIDPEIEKRQQEMKKNEKRISKTDGVLKDVDKGAEILAYKKAKKEEVVEKLKKSQAAEDVVKSKQEKLGEINDKTKGVKDDEFTSKIDEALEAEKVAFSKFMQSAEAGKDAKSGEVPVETSPPKTTAVKPSKAMFAKKQTKGLSR